jgi:uncharacterized protein (TIGR03437 family)
MEMLLRLSALLLATSLLGQAQTGTAALGNENVNGRYFFRQLQFSTDTRGNVVTATGSLGSLFFDGNGRFTVDGYQTVGNLPATPLTGSGNYSVESSGMMALSNPQRNGFTINARFGVEAILGSSTESADNTFDLFAAIPAPTNGQGGTLFQGIYSGASFELQNGTAAGARSALFSFPVAFGGVIGTFQATGHAANLQNGLLVTQIIGGASYALGSDGAGTVSFGGASPLLSGTRNLYVSRSGNVALMGSPYAGGLDFLVAVRQFTGRPVAANLSGLYWTGGLRLDLQHLSTEAYVGALNSAGGVTVTSERLHQLGIAPEEATLANPITTNTDGTLGLGFDILALGTGGDSFVAAGLSTFDTAGYSIDIGMRAPGLAPNANGTGVYLNPQGVLNAASLAPAGAAISPGEFVSLFGNGLSAAAMSASPPFPFLLGDVSVSVNGMPAALAYVSATQVNFLVPYAATGSTATVVVTNLGTASNAAVVPLQKTSPGVFSSDGSGTGFGAITHSNGSAVTVANPARRGETVVLYGTGFGSVTPAAVDGVPSSGTTVNQVAVTIAGQTAGVAFAGLSPSFPGLYQVNVVIPANLVGSGALPLAVQTVDAFHDQVDLQVQ